MKKNFAKRVLDMKKIVDGQRVEDVEGEEQCEKNKVLEEEKEKEKRVARKKADEERLAPVIESIPPLKTSFHPAITPEIVEYLSQISFCVLSGVDAAHL